MGSCRRQAGSTLQDGRAPTKLRRLAPILQPTVGQISTVSLWRSSLWRHVEQLPLTENMCLQTLLGGDAVEQRQLTDRLLMMGEGGWRQTETGALPAACASLTRWPCSQVRHAPCCLSDDRPHLSTMDSLVLCTNRHACPVSSLVFTSSRRWGNPWLMHRNLTRAGDHEQLLRTVYVDLRALNRRALRRAPSWRPPIGMWTL